MVGVCGAGGGGGGLLHFNVCPSSLFRTCLAGVRHILQLALHGSGGGGLSTACFTSMWS